MLKSHKTKGVFSGCLLLASPQDTTLQASHDVSVSMPHNLQTTLMQRTWRLPVVQANVRPLSVEQALAAAANGAAVVRAICTRQR